MMVGHEQLVEDFKRLARPNFYERNLGGRAEKDALSHGYILSGPARIGKKLFAISFANFLETGEFDSPSQILPGKIWEGEPFPISSGKILEGEGKILRDALLLEPDENRTIGIDEIRRIRNFLWQKPIVSKKRTVIVNDAEAMTGEAQNAVLKIAEEPPESSLFILIIRDSEKLWSTLQSRLQKIHFSSVPLSRIEDWLKKNFDGDGKQFESVAARSCGQPGLAWDMLFDERFKTLQKSGEAFLKSGFWARREIIKNLLEEDDFNLNDFLEILLMVLSGRQTPDRINPRLWHRILDLRRNADYLNLNPRLQLENLLNE